MEHKEQNENWSKILYGKPVSEEELKDINYNLSGFFGILKEWDDVDKMETKKDGDLLSNKRP